MSLYNSFKSLRPLMLSSIQTEFTSATYSRHPDCTWFPVSCRQIETEAAEVNAGAQRHDKRSRSNPEMDETKVQSEKSARHRSTEQESKTYGSRRLQSDFSEEAADKLIQDLLF